MLLDFVFKSLRWRNAHCIDCFELTSTMKNHQDEWFHWQQSIGSDVWRNPLCEAISEIHRRYSLAFRPMWKLVEFRKMPYSDDTVHGDRTPISCHQVHTIPINRLIFFRCRNQSMCRNSIFRELKKIYKSSIKC